MSATEPGAVPLPDDPTAEMTVISIPGVPHEHVVGSTLRPPRPITIGRRRSDRWMARLIIGVLTLMIVFVLATSWQQTQLNTRLDNTAMCRRTP